MRCQGMMRLPAHIVRSTAIAARSLLPLVGVLGLLLGAATLSSGCGSKKSSSRGSSSSAGGGSGGGGSGGGGSGSDTTAPTVTIEQKSGQADPATVDGIDFTLTFSEEINATTLTTADITQNGTATVESWVLTQVNSTTWELTAQVVRGSGTVIPAIATSRFADSAGNTNSAASSSSDNSVTHNEPMATVQFTQASSVVNEETSASTKTIGVTLSAMKSYAVGVLYVPAEAYTALGDTSLTASSYTLTIPAGQTSANISYTYTGDAATSRIVQLALAGTNSNAVQVGERQVHRQLVRDDDGGHDPFMDVSAGVSHSCGITAAGALYCWGLNSSGQLGDGTTTLRRSPVGVTQNLSGSADLTIGWTAVSAGGAHTCGINSGVLYCWGANASGQLGDSTTAPKSRPVEITSGTAYGAVSAGNVHTCAVTTAQDPQDLRCWGNGGSGRLGTGATANVNSPTVVTLPDGFSATNVLAAGFNHTCVAASRVCDRGSELCPLDPDPYIFYQLYCTGSDGYGQLGRSVGTGSSNSFVAVSDSGAQYTSLSSSKSAAAQAFSCGVTDGSLKCWGRNNYNQLGDGSTTTRTSPVTVGTGYSSVSAGGAGACAVNQSSGLMCWGKMQAVAVVSMTSSTYPSSTTPAATDSSEGYVLAAAGGEHRCAITVGGILKCWGASTYGVLGDGSSDTASTPVEIDPATTYDSVSVSGAHTCARVGFGSATGVVRCWGENYDGQLGDGQGHTRTQPLTLTSQALFKSVSAAGSSDSMGTPAYHSCGITSADAPMCWGDRTFGQLGDASTGGSSNTPVALDSGVSYSRISAGSMHSCGITAAGVLKCWGDGSLGQLGHGNGSTSYDSPTVVDAGTSYGEVAAGGDAEQAHTCAITAADDLYCWGSNDMGQLGAGTVGGSVNAPNFVTGNFSKVVSGARHSCGIDNSNNLMCWGSNSAGQLGDGTVIESGTPTTIAGDSFAGVSAGSSHTCAITTGNVLKCWGANASSQLGDGSTSQRLTPVVVDSGTSYHAVAAGESHSCGITTTGQLKCWGLMSFGLLGDGRFQSWRFPSPVW
jgi:alpha-tubulin suppressor-like RCC1 family protein